jgi:uncharacterized protein (TIGR00725 family)
MASRIGALLAQAGAVLISGGQGGVMRASCEAALSNGGLTVGILPSGDRAESNPFLTIALPTGLGQLRNGLVVSAADAVIAIGGGWGTLSEIALAMRAEKPVVTLHSWTADSPNQSDRLVTIAQSPEDAVRLALTLSA